MLNVIAPVSYERYAVLVSPLLVPDVLPVTAKQPPRQVEQLTPVNPTSRRADTRAETSTGEMFKPPVSQAADVPQASPVRSRTPPLHGPPPSDDKNFLSLPVHAVGSTRGQTIPDPRKLVGLYTPSENTRGEVVQVSV